MKSAHQSHTRPSSSSLWLHTVSHPSTFPVLFLFTSHTSLIGCRLEGAVAPPTIFRALLLARVRAHHSPSDRSIYSLGRGEGGSTKPCRGACIASPGAILVRLPSLTSKLICEIWKQAASMQGPLLTLLSPSGLTMTLPATTAPECVGQKTEWLELTSGLPRRLGVWAGVSWHIRGECV